MSHQLIQTEQGLALSFEDKSWSPIQVDFCDPALRYRINHIQGRNELIAKAIGWRKKDPSLTVIDATAGMGKEAFILATLGCTVTLLERNPIIFALLNDGLKRAAQDPEFKATIERMQLFQRCAIDYLAKLKSKPDVIYCDPMFEPKQNSALVKKEMQALQALVGLDNDAQLLVKTALETAQKRVVVKRGILSQPVIDKPSFEYKTKTHRFDVYVVSA